MASVSLPGIRVVAFDMDDTLYPERQYAFSGFDAVSIWLREKLTPTFDTARRMRELYDAGHRRHVFDTILAELGCDNAEDVVPQMVECYRTHRPNLHLLPDAARALARWKDIFQLALISDGPLVMQELKANALGLAGPMGLIVLTDQWGQSYWKPHPRAFEEVERWSGERGRACVYIADNAVKDFIAPRQLGWHTVWLCRPAGLYRDNLPPAGGEAEHTITSLDELSLTY